MPASIRPAARGDLPAGEVRAIEARPDNYEEWVEWDAAIGGRRRPEMLRLAVPGPHPALKPLLDAAFQISYVETFCSDGSPCFDPRRYSGVGDLL